MPLIEDRRKAYAFTLVLGRSTATGDASGATVATAPFPPMRSAAARRGGARSSARSNRCRRCTARCITRDKRLVRAGARGRQSSSARRARSRFTSLRVLAYAAQRVRACASRAARGRTSARCARISATAIGVAGAHGALLREASGPVRALREPDARRDRGGDPDAALVPPERVIPIPTIVLDGRGAADFRAGRHRAAAERRGAAGTSSFAIRRARSSASAKPSARCWRRARCSCEGSARAAARTAARPLVLAIGFFDGVHAAIARSCARCCACAGPASGPGC